ncbi:hypothetical protein [uncultured Paludibaculum sp.]|uniref:hypothetical protein n=1 Tax=uncultured Paludibaculum sp. TaxID=1765020 RepID=UPI002AAC1A2B|nr:hypothetical protein [uncultured Paludibaculum sp.]
MPNDRDCRRLLEQADYLEGVLWADPARRLDNQVDPDDIDPWGTGTAAFWRGLIESAGYIALLTNDQRTYPRLELRASWPVLSKMLEFLQEEVNQANGLKWDWDEGGKFQWQAGGGRVRVCGVKAQEAIRALYPPDSTVGLESIRAKVDRILTWTPRR